MRARLHFIAPALALLLSACAGTPGCGDSATKDLLNEIIEDTFQKSAYGREIHPITTYNVRGIRTVDHDKDTDVYECAATLELLVKGRKQVTRDIEYDVYSVQDADADFEIRYDEDEFATALLHAALAKALGRD